MKRVNAWCSPVDANPITAPYTALSIERPDTARFKVIPIKASTVGIYLLGKLVNDVFKIYPTTKQNNNTLART